MGATIAARSSLMLGMTVFGTDPIEKSFDIACLGGELFSLPFLNESLHDLQHV